MSNLQCKKRHLWAMVAWIDGWMVGQIRKWERLRNERYYSAVAHNVGSIASLGNLS